MSNASGTGSAHVGSIQVLRSMATMFVNVADDRAVTGRRSLYQTDVGTCGIIDMHCRPTGFTSAHDCRGYASSAGGRAADTHDQAKACSCDDESPARDWIEMDTNTAESSFARDGVSPTCAPADTASSISCTI
jgi:hypothetical protein